MAGFQLNTLCTPAKLYLAVSTLFLIVLLAQNYNNSRTLCLGIHSCQVSSVFMIFALKIIYILFWTWILNLICKSGATYVAWALFLFPFILFFVLLAMLFMGVY